VCKGLFFLIYESIVFKTNNICVEKKIMASYNNPSNERNQDATLFVGELESNVSESLLWELFLQAGPVGML
jgi:hypothetical protein